MSKFYKIHDLAPGLDGLVVELTEEINEHEEYYTVIKIYNTNVMFGDGTFAVPVNQGSLMIHEANLESVKSPKREFANDNPFGKQVSTVTYERNFNRAVVVKYQNAVTVTLIRVNPPETKGMDETIFSQNFFRENMGPALDVIDEAFNDLSVDLDDLVFTLKEIK
jgi:hypothetical protein